MIGVIKTLSKKRGFGFIRNENGEDVFFHHSNLDNKSFRNLHEGDNVEFTLDNGQKGLRATNIRIIKSDENNEKLMKSALNKLVSFFNK